MGKPVSEWQNSVTFNTFTGIAMLHIQCLKRAKERKTEESKHSRALVTQPLTLTAINRLLAFSHSDAHTKYITYTLQRRSISQAEMLATCKVTRSHHIISANLSNYSFYADSALTYYPPIG